MAAALAHAHRGGTRHIAVRCGAWRGRDRFGRAPGGAAAMPMAAVAAAVGHARPRRRRVRGRPAARFDRDRVRRLAAQYADDPCTDRRPPTGRIVLRHSLTHHGYVYAMALSPDGELLATASSFGTVAVWDTETWERLKELRDVGEAQIDEFCTVAIAPGGRWIAAAGKRKARSATRRGGGGSRAGPDRSPCCVAPLHRIGMHGARATTTMPSCRAP